MPIVYTNYCHREDYKSGAWGTNNCHREDFMSGARGTNNCHREDVMSGARDMDSIVLGTVKVNKRLVNLVQLLRPIRCLVGTVVSLPVGLRSSARNDPSSVGLRSSA